MEAATRGKAEAALQALRRGWPFGALLAFGLGLTVVVGANLSNAQPYGARPWGWPGAASFENGVAYVRPELVLAVTLPCVVWGARALRRVPPGLRPFAATAGVDLAVLGCATVVGTLLGAWGASSSPADALWAFAVAHGLLGATFYSIGLVAAAATRRWSLAAAATAWVGFVVLLDDGIKLQLFRQAGYANLVTGQFPSWFYLSQGLSPVAAYRALLIVWRPGFRDGLEHYVLDRAPMPGWVSPGNFAAAIVALWIAVPIALAAAIWWWRSRRDTTEVGLAAAMQEAHQMGVVLDDEP
ncbi:MAG: hypothetical protein V4510_07780 [bacterium]